MVNFFGGCCDSIDKGANFELLCNHILFLTRSVNGTQFDKFGLSLATHEKIWPMYDRVP